MSRIPIISALLLGAGACASAQEQLPTPVVAAPSGSAPVKVANYLRANAIIGTQEGQKGQCYSYRQIRPQARRIHAQTGGLQALRDQLKKGPATMERRGPQTASIKTIDAKNREVQRLGQDSQAALEQEEGALMQQLGDRLMATIRD